METVHSKETRAGGSSHGFGCSSQPGCISCTLLPVPQKETPQRWKLSEGLPKPEGLCRRLPPSVAPARYRAARSRPGSLLGSSLRRWPGTGQWLCPPTLRCPFLKLRAGTEPAGPRAPRPGGKSGDFQAVGKKTGTECMQHGRAHPGTTTAAAPWHARQPRLQARGPGALVFEPIIPGPSAPRGLAAWEGILLGKAEHFPRASLSSKGQSTSTQPSHGPSTARRHPSTMG